MNKEMLAVVEGRASEAEARAQSLLDYARRLRAGEVHPEFNTPPADEVQGLLEAELASLRERRQRQAAYLGPYVLEPAFDILLTLFSAHLRKLTIDLDELCHSVSSYKSTTYRWLVAFAEEGLVEIDTDDFDVTLVRMTEHGMQRVRKALLG